MNGGPRVVEEKRAAAGKTTGGQEAVSLAVGGYRGLIIGAYHEAAFLEALRRLPEIWLHPETVVLNSGRNRVGIIPVGLASQKATEIVVKEFSSRGVDKLKSLLFASKAVRAWRGALALERRGLETARPIGYLEKRKHGFVERSFFLTERLSGVVEVRHLFRSSSPDRLLRLLSGLARELSRLHDLGILHRDLSDGNVLVQRNPEGEPVFFFLDTNRVRVRERIGLFSRAKNLIRLGVPPAFRKHFLEEYFRPRTLPKAAWLWYKFNKAVFTGYIGLKKTLRLRRLARKLGIQ